MTLALALPGCQGCPIAPPPAPYPPSDLAGVAVSSSEVALTWKDNSSDEIGFYIYRKTTDNYSRIATMEANATSYNNTGLSPETSYSYKVTAYNEGGESESSNEITITIIREKMPPSAPFDLVATAVSSTQIDLTWKETSENEKGFYVYRKYANDFRKIAVLDSDTTSYSDSSLDPETTYWYEVTAYNDDGESSPSDEASATTLVEVEILDYYIQKYQKHEGEWYTWIRGEVRNNTAQILKIRIAGEFYSYDDELIAIVYSSLSDVNSGRTGNFEILHSGTKIETKYVKVWVDDYY